MVFSSWIFFLYSLGKWRLVDQQGFQAWTFEPYCLWNLALLHTNCVTFSNVLKPSFSCFPIPEISVWWLMKTHRVLNIQQVDTHTALRTVSYVVLNNCRGQNFEAWQRVHYSRNGYNHKKQLSNIGLLWRLVWMGICAFFFPFFFKPNCTS